MNFKSLFSRSLGADPERLHFASHSHHLWPDASFDGHKQAWNVAARLADRKWDEVMDEIWPEAQAEVAAELGTNDARSIVFASSTYDLLIRMVTAAPRQGLLRVLTSDGEFHSARRQFARWEEEGWLTVEQVSAEPFHSFSDRFLDRARQCQHDLIFVSQLLFGSGRMFEQVGALAALGKPDGPWVVIDGYHAFMAIADAFGESPARSAFYLGGGYKYAMAGEGCGFMHAPFGFAPRPSLTGWFASFEDLSLPPGIVGYAEDARRFLGATFDPSGLYRFIAVRRMLAQHEITTSSVSRHVAVLQQQLVDSLHNTPLASAELLNPLDEGASQHARFLAFRSPGAPRWNAALEARGCITDVRGDVLRIGFGIYHDQADVERLVELLGAID